jgi:hypothetical protein
VTRARPGKKSSRQSIAATEPARARAESWFEAGATAAILGIYAALLTHPIDLTLGDLGRHLKNGEMVVRSGVVAQTNLFSYTAPDHPFINHHWGSGVVYYLIESVAGFTGLSLFFLAFSVATVWLFLNLAAKVSSFPLAAILTLVSLPILITRHEIRPEMFTYLLSGLYLHVLWGYRGGRFGVRSLWVLPCLQLIWINLHIYFFLGIVLVGLALFEALIDFWFRKLAEAAARCRQLAVVLTVTVLVNFLNPAGVAGVFYPLFIMQGFELPVIETYSVSRVLRAGFHFLPLTYFLIILGCLCLSWVYVFTRDRENIASGNLILSAFVAAMAWMSIRNLALFAFLRCLWQRPISKTFRAAVELWHPGAAVKLFSPSRRPPPCYSSSVRFTSWAAAEGSSASDSNPATTWQRYSFMGKISKVRSSIISTSAGISPIICIPSNRSSLITAPKRIRCCSFAMNIFRCNRTKRTGRGEAVNMALTSLFSIIAIAPGRAKSSSSDACSTPPGHRCFSTGTLLSSYENTEVTNPPRRNMSLPQIRC